MLFTDIEGSTRLAADLGRAWPSVLEDHHRLLRAAIEGQDGRIESREGDAVFALFERAAGAVAAAAAAQAALRDHQWPAGHPVRVRMGIHVGEISRIPSGVGVGLDIHLAARVASAANGGQVLLTRAALAAVPGAAVEDLGFHRLKDFPAPERLFHLALDGAPAPAPRTASARPTNLPARTTPLLGREHELEELRDRFMQRGERLVTLMGPGGVGKTSLGLEAGRRMLEEHPGGVFFVALSGLRDPASIVPAIAEAAGVAQSADQDLVAAVGERLGAAKTLLIVDNAEHLVEDFAPLIAGLLARAAKLRVLVTSQAPLRVVQESVVTLRMLSPEDAAELFEHRAAAAGGIVDAEARPGVERICARIGGLPLGIELAAARVRGLGVAELEARLDDALTLLSRGPRDLPARQRSLRATLEWTCDLAGPEARRLLERASVFAGAAALDAIEAVCGDDLDTVDELAELVDLSLVQRREDLELGARYALPEAVRAFAAGRCGDLDAVRDRHARYVADVAWIARLWVFGPTAEHKRRVLALAAEERPALEWAREHDQDLYIRLAGALGTSWLFRGQAIEALDRLSRAVEWATVESEETLWARGVLAHVLAATGHSVEALPHAEAVVMAWRARSDSVGLALALNVRSYARIAAGDIDGSMADAEEANEVLSDTTDARLRVRGLLLLATKRIALGDPSLVEPLLDDADRMVGGDDDVATYVGDLRADCALMRRDYETALQAFIEIARLAPTQPGLAVYGAYSIDGLALALAGLGRHGDALELFGAYSTAAAEMGVDPPRYDWSSQLRNELYTDAIANVGADAEARLAAGHAIPSARRLTWAIRVAEKAVL